MSKLKFEQKPSMFDLMQAEEDNTQATYAREMGCPVTKADLEVAKAELDKLSEGKAAGKEISSES